MLNIPTILNIHRALVCLLISSGLTISTQAQQNLEHAKGVTVSPAKSLIFFPSRNAPAKTESLNQSHLPAQINAVVTKISVKVGDTIKQGETVARLDCREAKHNLAAQQAQQMQLQHQYKLAQRQLNRGKELREHKSISEAELDNLETNRAVAQAQLITQKALQESAILKVQYCHITAPFSGIVSKRIANVGEMLSIGAPVLEMVELGNLEVSAEVSLLDSLSFTDANSFYFQATGKKYPLNKRILLPVVSNETRSREARLNFTNQSALPGVTGRLFWITPQAHLPAHLLLQRNGVYGVFILQDKLVKFIEINNAQEGRPIPLADQNQWHNRQLVVDGRHGLINNQQVTVIQSDDNKSNRSHTTVGTDN